jgi:hypothetical protein
MLGTKTTPGCYSVSADYLDDNFTNPSAVNKFEGKDELKHRNSWLMPRMARRMTRHNKHHVSNWKQNVTIDATECERLRQLLEKNEDYSAKEHLPKACQK